MINKSADGSTMSLDFDPKDIVSAEIYATRDGYNYANVGFKDNDSGAIIRVTCEWDGARQIPELVMDIKSMVLENETAYLTNKEKNEKEYASFLKRLAKSKERV